MPMKAPNVRSLSVPIQVKEAQEATEILQAWVVSNSLYCTILPSAWEDTRVWGIFLADVARHIANALKESKDLETSSTIREIAEYFNKEIARPTGEPTGEFIE